ncbi:hypothetical protein SDC9_208100 [bioreactor metagenome]|uniref:Uncharacterized protein n=1 Tax=bioreactor metagenome TaxID=1076179 RepID=A0A645JB66_9ZZZZ
MDESYIVHRVNLAAQKAHIHVHGVGLPLVVEAPYLLQQGVP